MSIETLQDLVESLNHRDKVAISWKEDGKKWEKKELTYKELHDQILNYSKGFLELGLEKGDRVAIFSRNVPEWIALSLGINNAGLIDVPRGEKRSVEEISYILSQSEPKVVIVEDKELLQKVDQARNEKSLNIELILSIKEIEGIKNIKYVQEKGKNSEIDLPSVKKEDSASIIYTSGTTGTPLGVELTHGNFTSNLSALKNRFRVTEDDKFLSILPAWHVFERMVKYSALYTGAETFHSLPQIEAISRDFKEQRPTIMACVPQLLEKMYERVIREVNKGGSMKKMIFNASMKSRVIGHFILGNRIRAKLGDNFGFFISGGAALPPHIDRFFDAAGIEIIEGYGLTQASPVVSTRVFGRKSLYTVGIPLDGVKVKIMDPNSSGKEIGKYQKGIIYVKGPNIMKGYYKNPKKTKEDLSEDGWLNTKDLGYFDSKGNIKIAGRQDRLIIPRSGENVSPEPLEDLMKKSKYISESVVVGHGWKALGALIVPNSENLKVYCKENNIPYSDNLDKILKNPKIRELYTNEIRKFVNGQQEFKIREFILLEKPFDEKKVYTDTLKLKVGEVEKLYSKEVDTLGMKINA